MNLLFYINIIRIIIIIFQRSPPPYTGNENINEVQSIIPKALEGEIARLDQRFKVKLH